MLRSRKAPAAGDEYAEGFLLERRRGRARRRKRLACKQQVCRCCLVLGIVILVLVLVLFIGVCVVVPLSFMHSVEFQRLLLFQRYVDSQEREFTNFRKYGLEGARNLYIDVRGANETVTLGVWHILPLALVCEAAGSDDYDYVEALRRSAHPVLLYLHDTTGNRISRINAYRVYRKLFHVIAFDYRGYGDSTNAELTEKLVVQDSVQVYHWVRSQTSAHIFIWGSSWGAALGINTVAKLRKARVIPSGLILEAPFPSWRQVLPYYPATRMLSWLPWFDATILSPLEANGFDFQTDESILSVDCPIMVVHAEDDGVVPSFLGEELVNIALNMRDQSMQGNVTFHLFPAQFGLGHYNIYQFLKLPDYIRDFIEVCYEYNTRRG